MKNFYLPKIVKEADLVINVPKLKTHTLTKMTGAIKNLYGCVPGGVKQSLHREAIGEQKFSHLLIDIYSHIKPGLNIMDAVIAMEGEGPASGKPRKVGLILASRNTIALDVAASRLMGFHPSQILAIEDAVKRGLASYDIEVVGDFRKIPDLKFIQPNRFKRAIVKTFLTGMSKEKIVCDKEKCIKCGICMKHCPMKAITLCPYPEINSKKCIRCFCCIEVCPHHALHLQDNMVMKVAKVLKKMKK
jgi:ferredoxin